ncbi:hypothetical protein [Streptomyces sp. SP18CS02]|uniref:hypothetical protein n=1 Tax=Streptomyces sp. SP18CS02 TaxID=3002531 RepID=UPI002E7A12CC|nr:hypothetical protein [Streptomyces sp. SP18CS02]MEE1755762.1 hypothetical protein [Streptomyces sp. SP18CS02]
MSTPSAGRAVRLGACAAAAGLVTLGMATPALADSDQLWIQAPYEFVLPAAATGGQQPPASTIGLGLYHDNNNFTVTDGRLTVDISGLAGIADVTWPESCAPTGSTAVCAIPEVPANGGTPVQLTVRAASGAQNGTTGRITYQGRAATTMEGGELTAVESETTVKVASGPDLVLDRPDAVTGVQPGSTVPVPVSVVNNGNESANGVQVTLYVTRGLTLSGLAPQCVSTPVGEGAIKPVTRVSCAFDDVVAPGGSFTLPQPLTAAVAAYALAERVDINVEPRGGVEDLSPSDNGGVAEVKAVNTADFAVRGTKVSAAAGETVRAALTFRNKGPAWIANLGSGDPVANVDFVVPKGATATGVPESCEPRTLEGDWAENRIGAPRYSCNLPMWVAEKQTVTFPFELRIDTVIPGSVGKVTLTPPWGDQPLPFDPNRANDKARVVLNPAV